jgi:hypothetical protein
MASATPAAEAPSATRTATTDASTVGASGFTARFAATNESKSVNSVGDTE